MRCLSFHAAYQCQHSGDCCSAGWPIPVEADRLELVRSATSGGLLRVVDGRCTFHDAERHRCRLQIAHGHSALPLACRQFPRVVVLDPRGPSVTLSHYCPTARAMLGTREPFEIVASAPAFPDDGEYEGLDVRDAMPPLLRPDMLMDWNSWWRWETLAIGVIADRAGDPLAAIGSLAVAVDALKGWRPADGPLELAVTAAFQLADRSDVSPWTPPAGATDQCLDQMRGRRSPRSGRATSVRSVIPAPEPAVLSRFLAAHVFANWTAHLGEGLHAWLRSIEAAYLLAVSVGIGQADLFLRHLTDPTVLARQWSRTA